MKIFLKKVAGLLGVDLTSADLKRRMKIIRHYNIDTLFDIGANQGQYAKKMRQLGYSNRIISFEPLSDAFDQLKREASQEHLWTVHNFAIGDKDIKSIINIAGNSYSSSMLEMLPALIKNAPDAKYVAKQEVEIKRLDSVFPSLVGVGDSIMIKIDTQGFEKQVIDGATQSLKKTSVVQLEMSLAPLYAGEMLYLEMINYLKERGLALWSLETDGFTDPVSGQLLQVDGLFVRT